MNRNNENPVNWFEIPVDDILRAKEFYEYILGYELKEDEMGEMKMVWFPSRENGPGATGSLVKAKDFKPADTGVLVYFSVDDINDVLSKIEEKKGKVLKPKTSIGEWGYIAQFKDTEGNRVALHSMK